MPTTRIVFGLAMWLVLAPANAAPPEPDGGGTVQSMEAQTILIDGERYDLSGAEVRLVPGGFEGASRDNGKAPGRVAGTLVGDRSIHELAPRAVAARVMYKLRPGSDRRIAVIWFAAPAEE